MYTATGHWTSSAPHTPTGWRRVGADGDPTGAPAARSRPTALARCPKTTGPINDLTGVSAIGSFYDPGDASLHVFSVTQSGVYETYWFNSGGPKT